MSKKKSRDRNKRNFVLENVTLEKFVNGGQALGYDSEGKPVFVWGALREEKVDVLVTKAKRGILEGVAQNFLSTSPKRVEPREPEEYLSTSPWQILDFAEENKVKAELLQQTFQHEAGIDLDKVEFEAPEEGNEFGYRNKMEYAFWGDPEGVSLALHKRGTGQKIKLSGSVLASEAINVAGKDLVNILNKNKIFAGDLKSLILRSNKKGECVAALFVKKEDFVQFDMPDSLKGLVCYYSNPKSPASVKTSELWRVGSLELSDEVEGLELAYDVDSFFQVNVEMFSKVIQDIKPYLNDQATETLDFYGGVGSIGILLAGVNKSLKIIELNSESAEMAKANIERLGLSKAEVKCLPSEEAIEEIVQDCTLFVDPPRAGLHKKVVQQIVEVLPKQVIYLSCNPVTQARDIKVMIEAGYKISFIKGYNFFPRTPHIENLVILGK